ncbi:hypothetical protein BB561_000611 [Smittium simulii]|uniref:Coatomer subunit delta n=1 Tax=Smittium simulii TaxID=133385 RepID=A0A2T9YYD7_9FUNG|nr:hypothetical protein BB561_000611 [Smittium simulii]
MTRGYIEGLLSSFPKLMIEGQQHTTVETDAVRYVYQPLFEDMYAVLITTKNSNIVQDMDTLQLVANAIPEICQFGSQDDIVENALQLLSVFDEIVSLGHRENIDMAKLKAIIAMDSHEEKIQDIIEKNKEKEAKLELKRKAKMFEMQRKNAAKAGITGAFPSTGGIGSMGDAFGSKNSSNFAEPEQSTYNNEYSPKPTTSAPATRGMQLGRKTKGAEMLTSLNDQVVHVSTDEHISVVVNRDGGLENMEIKGDLSLIISEDDKNATSIRIACLQDDSIQYKTHPNIDKNQFNESGILTLKNQTRTFPLNQPVGVLKWRFVGQSEDSIPLSINCWPSATGDGSCEVNIEYELNSVHMTLQNVIISIPVESGAQPVVGDIDGSYDFNRSTNTLDWQISVIDRNHKTGSMDFVINTENLNSFFPVSVGFDSSTSYCQVQVLEAISENQSVEFSSSSKITPDQYYVI